MRLYFYKPQFKIKFKKPVFNFDFKRWTSAFLKFNTRCEISREFAFFVDSLVLLCKPMLACFASFVRAE